MNIIRFILIALTTTIIAYLTLCLFTPDRVIISETIIINRPVDNVFPKLDDVNEWTKWHPWFRAIKKIKYEIKQTDSVVGSNVSWISDTKKGGKIEITGYKINESIQMDITYEKDDFQKVNKSEFLIEAQEGRTKVSWILVGTQYPFYKKPTTIILKGIFAKNYEIGLENLKALCEGRPLPRKSKMDSMGED